MHAVLLAAAFLQQQIGYRTERHAELGLSLPVAIAYEPIPVPPDERFVVLAWAEKRPAKGLPPRELRPRMSLVWLDRVPEPDVHEESADLAAERPRPVNGPERWVELFHPGWSLGPAVEGRTREGWRAREHALVPRGAGATDRGGWLHAWTGKDRTLLVMGECAFPDLREQVRLWRATAEGLRVFEPEGAGLEDLRRRYAGRELADVERRIDARRRLVRGWKAEDTPHFVVVHDVSDGPLVRRVCNDLEALRARMEEDFPPVPGPSRVSVVRVCRDQAGYLAYGGSPPTAGYWNPETRELVIHDARRERKQLVSDDTDTFIALYHEAFHQYVHDAIGELAPHPWFNEGHGDWYSGAAIHGGKVASFAVHRWRVATIRRAVELGTHLSWERIVRFEQKDFLEDPWLAYAQSWSMVHFLRSVSVASRRPGWARILPVYYETLKLAWARELARLLADGRGEDRVARWQAGWHARQEAADAAFEDVDWTEIERAWREHVGALESTRDG